MVYTQRDDADTKINQAVAGGSICVSDVYVARGIGSMSVRCDCVVGEFVLANRIRVFRNRIPTSCGCGVFLVPSGRRHLARGRLVNGAQQIELGRALVDENVGLQSVNHVDDPAMVVHDALSCLDSRRMAKQTPSAASLQSMRLRFDG